MIPFARRRLAGGLPVRSRRLYGRPLRMGDGWRPPWSSEGLVASRGVFPMFDRSGAVKKLLLVLEGAPEVAMLDWRPGLVAVPWRGSILLREFADNLRRPTPGEFEGARNLWHFDSEYLLGQPGALPSSSVLVGTNCAGRWQSPVRSLFFRRDLSKIVMVSLTKADGIQLGRWKPDYLPAATPAPRAAPRSSTRNTWELHPIW